MLCKISGKNLAANMERQELENLRKEVAKLKKKINNNDNEHIVLTEVIINLFRKMKMI